MDARTEQLDVTHDVEAPRTSRRFVSTVLEGWAVPADVIDNAQLLVSEVVSNAVMHGRGPIRLIVSEARRAPGDGAHLRIEVSSASSGEPRLRHPRPDDLAGRGLRIVDELSGDWGTTSNDGETSVWFEMHADASV